MKPFRAVKYCFEGGKILKNVKSLESIKNLPPNNFLVKLKINLPRHGSCSQKSLLQKSKNYEFFTIKLYKKTTPEDHIGLPSISMREYCGTPNVERDPESECYKKGQVVCRRTQTDRVLKRKMFLFAFPFAFVKKLCCLTSQREFFVLFHVLSLNKKKMIKHVQKKTINKQFPHFRFACVLKTLFE